MDHDVIIIGSGPAGLAAATLTAGKGGKVLLLDEQLRPGGQIYRNVEKTSMDLLVFNTRSVELLGYPL